MEALKFLLTSGNFAGRSLISLDDSPLSDLYPLCRASLPFLARHMHTDGGSDGMDAIASKAAAAFLAAIHKQKSSA